MTEQEAPSFAIEKLYVKDLSLEVPNAPAIYLERESPEVGLQLQTAGVKIGDDVPVDHLIGKATFAFWSTDGSASYWRPWTWFSALRTERIGEDFRQ